MQTAAHRINFCIVKFCFFKIHRYCAVQFVSESKAGPLPYVRARLAQSAREENLNFCFRICWFHPVGCRVVNASQNKFNSHFNFNNSKHHDCVLSLSGPLIHVPNTIVLGFLVVERILILYFVSTFGAYKCRGSDSQTKTNNYSIAISAGAQIVFVISICGSIVLNKCPHLVCIKRKAAPPKSLKKGFVIL